MRTVEEVLFERKHPSRRLNAVGHFPGCLCETCWVLVERAIRDYLPGFLPEEPDDFRVAELEAITSRQREEIRNLRTELARLAAALAHNPTEMRGLDVDPR